MEVGNNRFKLSYVGVKIKLTSLANVSFTSLWYCPNIYFLMFFVTADTDWNKAFHRRIQKEIREHPIGVSGTLSLSERHVALTEFWRLLLK